MDVFKALQFYLTSVGMEPLNDGLNLRNLECLFLIGQFSISAFAFLFFRANNSKEYSESFYASITITMNGIATFIFMFKSKDVFKLIKNIERIVENRKLYIDISNA